MMLPVAYEAGLTSVAIKEMVYQATAYCGFGKTLPFLKKLKFGQFVRDDGPQAHLKKAGTPTMGGLIILLSLTITTLIYMKKYPDVLPVHLDLSDLSMITSKLL